MPQKFIDKHKSFFNFILLLIFAFSIGLFFWGFIRPQIIITSCSEIALSTSHIHSRTSLFIDTSESYELTLNECLSDTGLNPSTQ